MGGKSKRKQQVAPAPEPPKKQDFLSEQQEARRAASNLRRSTLFAGKNLNRKSVETIRPTLLGSFGEPTN